MDNRRKFTTQEYTETMNNSKNCVYESKGKLKSIELKLLRKTAQKEKANNTTMKKNEQNTTKQSVKQMLMEDNKRI